jgi:hypothetical protein
MKHEQKGFPMHDFFMVLLISILSVGLQVHMSLELHYGIGGSMLTLEEIGKRLSLTKERVRQIEVRAFKKVRGE